MEACQQMKLGGWTSDGNYQPPMGEADEKLVVVQI